MNPCFSVEKLKIFIKLKTNKLIKKSYFRSKLKGKNFIIISSNESFIKEENKKK
jgi:hypothetical protein